MTSLIIQCETMFENNYQCGGIKGHSGPCQDIDYNGALGEHLTNINGKNWCVGDDKQ